MLPFRHFVEEVFVISVGERRIVQCEKGHDTRDRMKLTHSVQSHKQILPHYQGELDLTHHFQ